MFAPTMLVAVRSVANMTWADILLAFTVMILCAHRSTLPRQGSLSVSKRAPGGGATHAEGVGWAERRTVNVKTSNKS